MIKTIDELRHSCRWGVIRSIAITLQAAIFAVFYWIVFDGTPRLVFGILMAVIAVGSGVLLVMQVRLYRQVCVLDRDIKTTESLHRFLRSSPLPKDLTYGIAIRRRSHH